MVDRVRSPKTAAAVDEAMACACELGNTVVAERLFGIYRLLLDDYRRQKVNHVIGHA